MESDEEVEDCGPVTDLPSKLKTELNVVKLMKTVVVDDHVEYVVELGRALDNNDGELRSTLKLLAWTLEVLVGRPRLASWILELFARTLELLTR